MKNWSVYLIRTQHSTLYTGIATDVLQRFTEHQSGKRGAKYLRAKGPLTLVYHVEVGTHSLAAKVEYKIKQLVKAKKENIVANTPSRESLLRCLNISENISENI
ncbi:MAG: hypothetical protein DCF15_17685 [Phormidesmis priestleyi]|uniref:GIY-YIG domain-containing protein n=1 Tax=Phormidesmis priestleyi TaxID=268141 RepID=A0A2W4WU30_9CYAN|nr:MAG: hypothetical protein DCF15_17685 [Phormidesmis priestleyi]